MPERVRTTFVDSDDEPAAGQKTSAPESKPRESESGPVKRKQQHDQDDVPKKKNKKSKKDGNKERITREEGKPKDQETPKPANDMNTGPREIKNGNKRQKQKANTASRDEKPAKPNLTSLKEKAKRLYETRKNLPIFPHGDEIRHHLRQNDVMLLVGETGSGKSTQIPQFLVDEAWCRPTTTTSIPQPQDSDDDGSRRKDVAVGGCIAITAATSSRDFAGEACGGGNGHAAGVVVAGE